MTPLICDAIELYNNFTLVQKAEMNISDMSFEGGQCLVVQSGLNFAIH